MQIDMYKKRQATIIVLGLLGASRLPVIGEALQGIMQFEFMGIKVEWVLAGLAIWAAFMMQNKEI